LDPIEGNSSSTERWNTLSRIVNRQQIADEDTIEKLVRALRYPKAFFFRDDIDPLDVSSASFRSLRAMTALERDAALSAGSLAYELTDWTKGRFNLPLTDILDLSHERDPGGAARTLRQYWAIGEKPIANMVKLLETKGARVFSLAENTRNVDALPPELSSVWQMILTDLWKEGISRHHIAADLAIPDDEMENLLFGLMGDVRAPIRSNGPPSLKII
jgi:hypothetical protein